MNVSIGTLDTGFTEFTISKLLNKETEYVSGKFISNFDYQVSISNMWNLSFCSNRGYPADSRCYCQDGYGGVRC